MIKIVIPTSDKTMWALRPFAYLLRRYWPEHPPVIVGGYTAPTFRLPDDFEFRSIGRFADYPAARWSDGVIALLNGLSDDYLIVMMDDYWLNRRVDHSAIVALGLYIQSVDNVARLDLTADRLGAAGHTPFGAVDHLDIIKSDPASQYHFSMQAALWRRDLLLNCLAPHETPWECEIAASGRLAALGYTVLGTRQAPLRYTIAVQQGKLALDGGYQTAAYALQQTDADHIKAAGWIPDHVVSI